MFTQIIATKGTILDKSLETAGSEPMLPRGSALITTAGNLAQKGITAIINAATGAMTKSGGIFEPTQDAITHAIYNCFTLLTVNGFKKLAVPFIGGNIFRGRIGITKAQLAKLIVDACFKGSPKATNFVIVIYGTEDYTIFQNVIAENYPTVDTAIILKEGSVIDYNLHHCDTIMNASNMEVQFGGGLAGIIGNATGEQVKINTEALTAIKQFWNDQV